MGGCHNNWNLEAPSTTSLGAKVSIVTAASVAAHFKANSLNDCLHSRHIAELCGTFLGFYLPKYATLADIEKAFLNVSLQVKSEI